MTSVPQVQRDLALAVTYWQITSSTLAAPCSPETVTVQTLVPATAAGTIIPANEVGAETMLGSCAIALSPNMWALHTEHRLGRRLLCDILTHEYGHTLGLPDDTGNDMMNEHGGSSRQCAAAYPPKRRHH